MKKMIIEDCEQLGISTIVRKQKEHIFELKPNITRSEMVMVLDTRLHSLKMRTLIYSSPFRIYYTHTFTHFGGKRYWLICPSCRRRVGKLYMPPECKQFLCWHCHELTYRLTQTHNKRVAYILKNLQDLEYTKSLLRSLSRSLRGQMLILKAYDRLQDTPSKRHSHLKRLEEQTYDRYIRSILEAVP